MTIETPELSLEELKDGKKFKIKATVKNTGALGGKETSQCYIRAMKSTMIRPQRELKGFVKEFYAPGEEKEICFELGFDELAFYNAKSDYFVESGEFEIYIGTSCYAQMMSVIKVVIS